MIHLIRPSISFEEVEPELRAMFESGVFTRGKNVEALRSEIGEYTGARHVYTVTSATTALWVCLRSLGIGPGDEVVVSDFSFPASANVIVDVGAKPVFADVSPDHYNMTPEALERALTPATKAVMFVDAFGNPTGIHAIREICRARGLPLIEDAACAIGSSEHGVRCGAIADLTCFSFHPRKLLNTGEGGAVTFDNPDWVEWFDVKLGHGASGALGYGLDFTDYGYNFRLSEAQAILGRAQLRKLDEIIAERQAIRDAFVEEIGSLGFRPQEFGDDAVSNVQSLVFRVPPRFQRDALIAALRDEGIETTIGTYCLSGTSFYRRRHNDVQPVAQRLQQETITFPCYGGMDVERVLSAVTRIAG
ncbi:DegT/DnrJ/EryC1/StrS family aminotransferase [Tsuneonella sp. YG55]|uniref:DegT/DnrJ/EryC1/StrS family aminotransferase n=1 Tax=Tsuneonella litorea TaxID=2976475 RepID=A0A9X3AK20_9SPHN|nr:DegT/DnrJ/EryC1/StrS family aminotransferase [Tsuneonella litorea]MCT2557794.1 DegT/DnrJ/EryC1/StrS family aminotransferase [Tsuneonella litorea]